MIPEIAKWDAGGGVTIAYCETGTCCWVESDESGNDLDTAIAEHRQWHKDGTNYGSERTMPDVPEVNVKMNGSTVIHNPSRMQWRGL